MRRTLLLLTLPLLAGCFRYVPTEPSAVDPATTVRARLTEAGAERHRARLGLDDATLEGTVTGLPGGGLELVTGGVGNGGEAPMTLRFDEIAGLERRELDRGRTLLAVGGGIALGAAILELAGGESAAGPGTGGGPDFVRVPLLRLPWR